MSIMVHTCCAPCGTYVFRRLREEGHAIRALYYNPNIQPFDEFQRRRVTLEKYAGTIGLAVIYEPYESRQYWQAIGAHRAKPKRCEECYRLRLMRTASRAVNEGCEAFTTTLLISPYQNHERIKAIAEEIASETGTRFHYVDYRVGYRESRAMAKDADLYCQKYCGCLSSKDERG